ncbi:hypothetical protein BV20DRAFT_952880 [Pilatotrama ljubarskyi]|nr:hypothetical protein BV20DRAFT_952880 [Pilatotrama ljubarskyi]
MGWTVSSRHPITKVNLRCIDRICSQPRALLDKHDKVFAMLVGSPKDQQAWAEVNAEVQTAFDEARREYKLDLKQENHRRGSFPAVAAGISYGGGQTRVSNLAHSPRNKVVIEKLLANPAVRRLAGFGDAAFKLYAPRLYMHYSRTMQALRRHDCSLKPNFKKNVFGSATFNLGPRVVTYVHTDHLNLPAGWCAITAIGRFDPTKGGHLLLWDLGLMVEFPPGALVLIPSAILRHSNTTVRPHERRYSFTQYSAGGLFRWVECGFKTQSTFYAEGSEYALSGAQRWTRDVGLWSTWDELRAMQV